MLMKNEYLDDLKEMLREEPESTFARGNTTREAVLADQDIMERLWTCYQKDVDDYDCDSTWSFQDAMHEVLGIEMPAVPVATPPQIGGLRVETPLGALLARASSDPPGIQIDLRRTDADQDLALALIELGEDESGRPTIITHVYGDAVQDAPTDRQVHVNIEKFFEEV